MADAAKPTREAEEPPENDEPGGDSAGVYYMSIEDFEARSPRAKPPPAESPEPEA